jgi:hypothetical protein
VATSVHCRNNPQPTMISLSTEISEPLDFAVRNRAVSVALFFALELASQIRPKSLILKVEATSGIEPEYTVLQTVA